MNPKTTLLLILSAACCAPLAQAQLTVNVTSQIRLGRALPPPPPEVVVVDQVGPPSPNWGGSHWYRPSRAYYYYPGSDVYYRPADHMWYYLDGGSWRYGTQLPDRVNVDFGRAVSLSLDTDRPYTYHQKVVASYPRNYFTHVRFKNDRDNRRDDRHDDRHDDRRDDHRDDRHDNNDRDKDRHR